jgi:hypothetical protein
MSFDPKNCSLERECKCAKLMHSPVGKSHDIEYWNCPNWGRSTLTMPALVRGDPHYTGKSRDAVLKSIDARKRKMDKYHSETNKRLREIRHSDPVRHLEKKGVKI